MWTKDMSQTAKLIAIIADAVFVQTDYIEYGQTAVGCHYRVTAKVRETFHAVTSFHVSRFYDAVGKGRFPKEWKTFEISAEEAAEKGWPERVVGEKITVYVQDELYIVPFPYLRERQYARDVQMHVAHKAAYELRQEYVNPGNLAYQEHLLRSR